ncbi:MAG: hypothetical protein ACNI3H_02440 [Halarcobacter ebronensis]
MKLEDWTVFATSYGGDPIAKIIANKLRGNFDLLLSSKIMAPNNEDCEIAIVTESEEVVIHEELVKSFEISLDFIFSKSKQIYDNELSKTVSNYIEEIKE